MAGTYVQHIPVEAGFETLEEARINGPAVLSEIMGKDYAADPALDDYPAGTTWVYHSAGLYTSATAAYRMNTNILVYTDKTFADTDEAYAYVEELGLIPIIDQACGSVVLVTPIDKEAGFGAADAEAYFKLQAVQCNLGGGIRGETGSVSFADNLYYGGLTYRYLIGIDGGAAFLCDYIASNLDDIGRVGGMLLINASMDEATEVAGLVPVYLVNSDEVVFEKFQAVNGAYAEEITDGKTVYFNQEYPVRRVAVASSNGLALSDYVTDAYYSFLVKALRCPVVKSGLIVPLTDFASYAFNQSPYALEERNAIIDGVTADGIVVIEYQDDELLADIEAQPGEYMRVWYECLPQEVLDGTAGEHSIPVIICNHGGGDDPVQCADELGILTLAGKERIAVIAPREASDTPGVGLFSPNAYNILGRAIPKLMEAVLEKYPALDPSRIYTTGYSMGGAAALELAETSPYMIAAAVPMAAGTMQGLHVCTEEEIAAFANVDVPLLFTTSSYDGASAFNSEEGILGGNYQEAINLFMGFNEMGAIDYDFEAYPIVGFKADKIVRFMLNDEYENTTWMLNNEDGVPMLGVSFTADLAHALHPSYGELAWNFMKHYSRNPEDGTLIYIP